MENKEHIIIQHLRGIRKIVINQRHGGFGLSDAGIQRYLELKGITWWAQPNDRFKILGPTYWLVPPEQRIGEPTGEQWRAMSLQERQHHNTVYSQQVFSDRDLDRDDLILVQVVQELGDAASGKHAELKIVEIPADVEWQIEEYDGLEWIAEKHRTWR